MEQFEKVVKGLECCKRSGQTIKPIKCEECPYKDDSILNAYTVWQTCKNKLADNALALIRQQHERIGELEKYRRLQVHNIGNVDIPDGVTMEQFCEIMDGVIKALEHTEKGESWPYKPPKEEEHATD